MKATCPESVVLESQSSSLPEALGVIATRAACALEQSLQRFVRASDQNLGHLEDQAARAVQALLRAATQRAAQAKADAAPPLCPVCRKELTRLSEGHSRTFDTRFGSITIQRTRGYCKRCRKWRTPADAALGLEETAGYSPAVQEMAALLASKMPVQDASLVLEHLTGIKLPRATLDREARRQGERAQRLRTQMDQQAATGKHQLELTLEPYQMIIQMDAWNIRERDDWGQSATRRRAGKEPERWHWVYTGTCFRLDHRGQTAGGRPVITERGFVSTRQGIDALREQLHAESLRRGLGQAASALVIGDGAVWRRQSEAQSLAQTVGPTTEEPIRNQSHPTTRRSAGRTESPSRRRGGDPGGELFSRTSGAHGLSRRSAPGRTPRQRAGGSDLSANAMPFQTPGTILESERR
jgi:hypothetical protein